MRIITDPDAVFGTTTLPHNEDEIEQESWTIVDPESDLIARQHDITLWKNIMSGISPYHRILANAPDEVLAN